MLDILSVESLDNTNLNIVKKKSVKKQILLYDTSRRFDDFVSQLKYRRNGSYDNIPHYIVSKQGLIYKLFDTNFSSNTFNDEKIDKRFIKIAIENLGWLRKNTITGFLHNWIGDSYRTAPYIREWRNHFFWDTYPDEQITKVSELCEVLCEKHNIPKKIVPSQGYLENILKFQGVVCKSNFSNIYMDINPSFKFNIFFKHEEQKQL